MNTEDAARMLSVHVSSIHRWIHDGKLGYREVEHPLIPGAIAFDISEHDIAKALGGIHVGLLRELKTIPQISYWLRSNDVTILEFAKRGQLRVIVLPHIPGEAQYLRYRVPRAWVESCFGLSMDIQLASMQEAVAFLGLYPHSNMVRKWIMDGSLQAIPFGDTYRIKRNSLIEWKKTWVRKRPVDRQKRTIVVRGVRVTVWNIDAQVLRFLAERQGTWVWQMHLCQTLGFRQEAVISAKRRLQEQLGSHNLFFERNEVRLVFLMVPFNADEIIWD